MKKIYKKSYYQLEKIIKGVSNHRRIEILELLKKRPELSIIDIAQILDVNFKTISEHVRKLAAAGFVLKRYVGHSVRHKLTRRALLVLRFLRTLK